MINEQDLQKINDALRACADYSYNNERGPGNPLAFSLADIETIRRALTDWHDVNVMTDVLDMLFVGGPEEGTPYEDWARSMAYEALNAKRFKLKNY